MQKPVFGFDGGFIMASWDRFEEAADWYGTHFGWEPRGNEQTAVGKMAFFGLPLYGQMNVKSFQTEWEHYRNDGSYEGSCRLCFCVADLEAALRYFGENSIQVSEPQKLPDGREYIEIEAFEGAKITAVHKPLKPNPYPASRLIGFGDISMIIHVSNLAASVNWYETILGFEKVADGPDSQSAVLRMVMSEYGKDVVSEEFPHHVWMIEDPSVAGAPRGNPKARAYFQVFPHELEQSRSWLVAHDVPVSELALNDYHFYDPDGNRLNVWSYQI